MNKALERRERKNFRHRRAGKIEYAKMCSTFPRLVVYWSKNGVKKREYCDFRRAASIVTVPIEEIFHNLEWGEGNWETDRFQIQSVTLDEWERNHRVPYAPSP
jgi:hypothetical protein